MFPPSAPEPAVVIEVHTTSCTVSYQPPENDGGAPVTGYILEHRTAASDSEWIRVNDTPVTDLQYTVDNLTPATEYEFRVAAENKAGMSDFSQISAMTTTGKHNINLTYMRPSKIRYTKFNLTSILNLLPVSVFIR